MTPRSGLALALGLAATCAAAQDGGWTLRAAPNSSPVAVSDGPGAVRNLLVFCLSGEPFLAIAFREARGSEEVRVGFTFVSQEVEAQARREPGAGGAYVIGLRDQPLAELLAGRDSSASVAIDGADQGALSLAGSTKAIHGALESCQAG